MKTFLLKSLAAGSVAALGFVATATTAGVILRPADVTSVKYIGCEQLVIQDKKGNVKASLGGYRHSDGTDRTALRFYDSHGKTIALFDSSGKGFALNTDQ